MHVGILGWLKFEFLLKSGNFHGANNFSIDIKINTLIECASIGWDSDFTAGITPLLVKNSIKLQVKKKKMRA